jgi:hypothetical protein
MYNRLSYIHTTAGLAPYFDTTLARHGQVVLLDRATRAFSYLISVGRAYVTSVIIAAIALTFRV